MITFRSDYHDNQTQVAELQQHTFGGHQSPAREDQKAPDPYQQYAGGNPAYGS